MKRANETVQYRNLSPSDRESIGNLLRSRPDRRTVLNYLAGLGISAAAAVPVLTAAEKALAETPKKGGRLVVAHSAHGPSDTLDPIRNTATIDYLRGRMIYGSLVRLSDSLVPEPELAEALEPNSSATEWTFSLRKGVEFHDGKPLTADDVIYSMYRHMGQNSQSAARTLLEGVTEWRKIDDHTVKAFLEAPNIDLPAILGTFHFKIVQNGATDFTKPQGTGPFRMEKFEPGIGSLVTAFENYWGDGPYVNEIEYFAIAEDVRRITALITGEVDIIGDLPSKSIRQVEAASGIEVWAVDSAAYYNIAVRKDIEPGTQPDLILALKYLFNREGLVETILGGKGTPGNDHPIGAAYPEHCSDFRLRAFDPEQAQFHLKRAGMAGIQIQIVAAEVAPGIVDMCLLLQREAARIGLNVEIQRVPTEGYWASFWLKAPICVAAWNMRPTANAMLSLAYHSDAAWNESRWRSKDFDWLLAAARGETKESTRQEMYCDLQEMVHSQAGTAIPVHRSYVGAHKTNVKGLTASPLAPLGGCEWPEFVWLDDA
ncbi:MAG: ABC transporter substrate-binding protein [Pseudomonadota bacterium]